MECFFPALRKIGYTAAGKLGVSDYPAGGGDLTVESGTSRDLKRFEFVDRGKEVSRSLEVLISNLLGDISKRELVTASSLLNIDLETGCKFTHPDSRGLSNALNGRFVYETGTVMFVQFGEKGVSSEQVGRRPAKQMKTFAARSAAIDHHLADQLSLPLALEKGGEFSTLRPSLHAKTNANVIAKLTGRTIGFEPREDMFICNVS